MDWSKLFEYFDCACYGSADTLFLHDFVIKVYAPGLKYRLQTVYTSSVLLYYRDRSVFYNSDFHTLHCLDHCMYIWYILSINLYIIDKEPCTDFITVVVVVNKWCIKDNFLLKLYPVFVVFVNT